MGLSSTIGLCSIQFLHCMSTQRKAPFSLWLGRDPIVPLNSLLMPTVRFLGTDENNISLKKMYQFIASNLEQARKKRDTKTPVLDDSVLLKNYSRGVWDPRYTGYY